MAVRSISNLLTLALVLALSHSLTLEQLRVCEISIKVNKTSTADWKTDYVQYQERRNYSSSSLTLHAGTQLNLTISELQEALLALNSTVFHKVDCCTEIILSQGIYTVSKSVYLTQNVRLTGEVPGEVSVDFSRVIAPQNVSFYNVITIFGSEYVEIRGITFLRSPGIVAVEKVTQVIVTDCIFKWFSRGALDIYQSFMVIVDNCTFENNGWDGVVKSAYQYRGHAGGLSIGFDDNHYDPSGTNPATVPDQRGIFVSGCTFRNNTSDPRAVFSTTELLQLFVFTGRGGAITITVNSSFPLNASLSDCVIEDNSAVSYGGGLYLGYSGYAAHTTVINRTVFARNQCSGPAGALQLGFIEAAYNGIAVRLELYNSEFYDNSSPNFGGAIHLFANRSSNLDGVPLLSQVAHIQNCTFMRNSAKEFGAAICFNSVLFLVDTSSVAPVRLVDCLFSDNVAGRAGVLSTAYLPLSFDGLNKLENNHGRALVISGTRAEIHGIVQFLSNDADGLDSGALYVTSFGQLQLFSGAKLIFTNNTGSLGASIVVEDVSQFSGDFSKALYNPLCVLRSENTTDSPLNWKNVEVIFSGNRALLGSAVLTTNIDLCSWTDTGPQFFDKQQVFRWNFIDFINDNVNTAHYPQETNPLWYVQSQIERIFPETLNVYVYPGELFPIRVNGIDEFGQPITVPVRLIDVSGNYNFIPSASSPTSVKSPNIVTTVAGSSSKQLLPVNVSVTSIFTESSQTIQFSLTVLPCPVGYILQETSASLFTCECNDEANAFITQCDDETVQLADGLWGVGSAAGGESGDRLTTYPCPQHYCQCLRADNDTGVTCQYLFNPDRPDDQCFCQRKGLLCGSCAKENAGFSAVLNNCKSCGKTNILFVAALVVLDVLIIGGLLLFLKNFVYISFYPTLFFLQIAPYVTLNFPVTFEVVHPYVFYVSNGLSFYFVYDLCLWPQLSAVLVYFIRFIPTFVTAVIAVPVIIIRCFCQKNRADMPGLWLVILFQYTHVVHTCMTILNCPILPGRDGTARLQWYINGNIQCFTGGHIPLALLSLAVLIIFVIILPLTIMYTTLKLKKHGWLYNITVPSSDAYKQEYPWWGALELLRRVIIVLFAVALPDTEYWTFFFLAIIVGVHLFVQPYREHSANVIEAILASNLLVLLLLKDIDVYEDNSSKSFISLKDYSSKDCIDSSEHIITTRTLVLSIFYHIPLMVFILVSLGYIVRLIYSRINSKNKDQEAQLVSSYQLLRDGSNVDFTTTVVTTNSQQMALSSILGDTYKRKRNNKKQFIHSLTSTSSQIVSSDLSHRRSSL